MSMKKNWINNKDIIVFSAKCDVFPLLLVATILRSNEEEGASSFLRGTREDKSR